MALGSRRNGSGIPHEVRTAIESRQRNLYPVRLSSINQVNPTVRLLRLNLLPLSAGGGETGTSQSTQPLQFLPGQWLDVHIPSIPRAGGFTITSTPGQVSSSNNHAQEDEECSVDESDRPQREPYIELAVQYSPTNPPAAWLWKPESEILGTELNVRVGGSFVWPPPGRETLESIRKVVFVAGGVGINPIISMLSHIYESSINLLASTHIHLIYSTRLPTTSTDNDDAFGSDSLNTERLDQILFLPRIRKIIQSQRKAQQEQLQDLPLSKTQLPLDVRLHVTNLESCLGKEQAKSKGHFGATNVNRVPDDITRDVTVHGRRITLDDLKELVGGEDADMRSGTVCYVCGPPAMTDEFVGMLQSMTEPGDSEKRVFFEKWW